MVIRSADLLISDLYVEVTVREQNYGKYQKPADYLDSFTAFVKQQLNQSAALAVVVSKPRDLTREQLKEIHLLLDSEGYSEAKQSCNPPDETRRIRTLPPALSGISVEPLWVKLCCYSSSVCRLRYIRFTLKMPGHQLNVRGRNDLLNS